MKLIMAAGVFILSCFLTVATLGHGKFTLQELPNQIDTYLETKLITPEFLETIALLQQRKKLKPYSKGLDMKLLDGKNKDEAKEINCDLCETMVSTMFSWVDSGNSRQEIIDKYVELCTTFNLASASTCRASAEIKVDIGIWIYSTKNTTDYPITPKDFCGFNYYTICWVGGPQYEWELDLDFLGPKPLPETPQEPELNSPSLKVLQFTDIHIDPNYTPGGNAECDDHNCCRFDQGAPENESAAAGYWGDYRDCDTPFHAFEDMLNQATTHDDIAYVIFTGDVIDHGVWATSTNTNRDSIIYAMTAMLNKFPQKIFPIFGNHDAHPTHTFVSNLPEVPDNISTNWLYTLADYIWSAWILNSSETILKGGYYSHEVYAGLKIIALNSMLCYNYNWWLMYDNVDPGGQLMWLAQELLESEQKSQKVHILSHVPNNADCMPNWQKQYLRILDRFENIVVAQFHGHTHNEHFNLFYDPNDRTRATQVAFIGGSGTAYSDVNPNYRIYSIDGDYDGSSYRVLDHETWSYNLTEANLAGPDVLPNWQRLYGFKETFGVDSMLPQEMDSFVRRLASDTVLQDMYYRYYWTMGDPALNKPCDEACRLNFICEIVRTTQGDDSNCDELMQYKSNK